MITLLASCPPAGHCRLRIHLLFALFLAPLAGLAQSPDPYTEKLQAGDAKAASGDLVGAASSYEAAEADAQTPTQTALALGKKAMVLVQAGQYPAAQEAADRALATSGSLEPVAEVTALQALAKCQLQDKNYRGALESMVRADSLQGVDWARANLALIRGDAERGAGQLAESAASFRKIFDMSEASDAMKGVAWLNIGLVEQYGLKNGPAAREAYAKAVELNPGLKAEADAHAAKIP